LVNGCVVGVGTAYFGHSIVVGLLLGVATALAMPSLLRRSERRALERPEPNARAARNTRRLELALMALILCLAVVILFQVF
jgi:hypothetical protein